MVVVVVVDVEQEVEQVVEHVVAQDVEHVVLVLHEVVDAQPWLPPQLDWPLCLCIFFPPEPWELHASGAAPAIPTRASEPRINARSFCMAIPFVGWPTARGSRGQERPSRRAFHRFRAVEKVLPIRRALCGLNRA